MNKKEKTILLTLAVVPYLLSFSTRLKLTEYRIFGTNIINDFTRVFLFEIDIVVILAVVLLSFLLSKEKVVSRSSLIFLLAFILWSGISFLLAPAQTWLGVAQLIRLILAALLFVSILKLPAPATFSTASLGLVIGGVVQSIFAGIQFVMQKSTGLTILGESPLQLGAEGVATFTVFGQKFLRAYGTLPHPNILALFLMISFLAALALVLDNSMKKFKKYTLPALIIIAIGLTLTFSRTFIILTLLSGSLIWCFYKYSYKNNRKKLKIFISGMVVLLVFLGIFSLRPVNSDNSLSLRALYSNANSKVVQENPITGVGGGQSVVQGSEALQQEIAKQGVEYKEWMHQPVHNTYLLILSETGWVGLIFFFLFLIFATNGAIKKLRRDPIAHYSMYYVFSVAAALAIIVAMFLEHSFITNPNSLYLSFIVLALIARARYDADTNRVISN